MATDVRSHERGIAEVSVLVAAAEPARIRGVGLDHPQVRVRAADVVVGRRRPFLVRAADEIHPELAGDVRRIMQRLRQVVDPAPDENPQRARVGTFRALDDPRRAVGRAGETVETGGLERPLHGHRPQLVRGGIPIRVRMQARVVALVEVEHFQDLIRAAAAIGRGNQPLDVEPVRVDQQVHEGLVVVVVGDADVGGHDDARLRGRRQTGNQHRHEDEGQQRAGPHRGHSTRQRPNRHARPDVTAIASVDGNDGCTSVWLPTTIVRVG